MRDTQAVQIFLDARRTWIVARLNVLAVAPPTTAGQLAAELLAVVSQLQASGWSMA